jgi:LysM repeat protein
MNKSNSAAMVLCLFALCPAALLTGCGREQAGKSTRTEQIATENTLPPLNPNQYEASAPAHADTTNASLAQNAAPTVTNTTPPVVSPADLAPHASKEYVVLRGDTLSKIARTHGVRLSALTKANPKQDLSKLKAGQKIQIPAPTHASAGIGFREPGTPGLGAGESTGNVHVVKAGETLTQIAKQNHTTPKAIQSANGLKTTRLLVGQKLRMPAPAQPATSAASAKPVEPAQPSAMAAK